MTKVLYVHYSVTVGSDAQNCLILSIWSQKNNALRPDGLNILV